MHKNKLQITVCTLALLGLAGCNSDDSDSISAVAVEAELAEDTLWQSEAVFSNTPVIIQNSQHGSIELGAQTLTYSPAADFFGTDQAVVEAGSQRFTFNFTVTPVNDAPQVKSSKVSISSEDTYTGELVVTDVDSDSVDLDIAEQPAKGIVTLNNDNSFIYTLDELSLPAESFVVTANDGTLSVDIEVELVPAYNTNAEKAAYYYRSEHSHLRQAEVRLDPIQDDITTQEAYISLAAGYLNANLPEQTDAILNTHINTQAGQADAYQQLALVHDRFSQQEEAQAKRLRSVNIFTSYLADNGLDNIARADGSFLLSLINDFNNAGDTQGADQTAQQLFTIAEAIGGSDTEYQTAFGFLVTAARNEASAQLESFMLNQSQANRERAHKSIDRAFALSRLTGYQLHKRGDNAGKRKYQLSPLYAGFTTDFYFQAGDEDGLKDALAWLMSYYTEANYDENNYYAVKPYAEVSLAEYTFPLVTAAKYFALYYPDLANLPLNLIPQENRNYSRAEAAVAEADALNLVINENNINAAVASVQNFYGDDLLGMQEAFSGRISTSPFTGGLLSLLGYQDEAAAMFSAGLDVLASDAYLNQRSSRLYTTSTRGCLKYAAYIQPLQNDALTNKLVNTCSSLFERGFATPDYASVTLLDSIEAHQDMAQLYQFTGNNQQAVAMLNAAAELVPQLSEALDQDQQTLAIARALVALHEYDTAYQLTNVLVARWTDKDASSYPDNTESNLNSLATFLTALSSPTNNDSSLFRRPSIIQQLRLDLVPLGDEDNTQYQQQLARFNAQVSKLSEELHARFATQPATVQIDRAENVVTALAASRHFADAEQLLEASALNSADKLQWLALISSVQARQDDFPDYFVASVDTDQDGLVNFFAQQASDEAIEESQLQADEDSDNDGTPDNQDPTPLG